MSEGNVSKSIAACTTTNTDNSQQKYMSVFFKVDPKTATGKLSTSSGTSTSVVTSSRVMSSASTSATASTITYAADSPAEHICYKCGVAFLTLENLQTHVQNHVSYELQKYSCGMCLSQLSSLQAMIEHTKTVVCTQCNMAYPCVRHARAHMKCHPSSQRVSIPRINSTVRTPLAVKSSSIASTTGAVSSSKIVAIAANTVTVPLQVQASEINRLVTTVSANNLTSTNAQVNTLFAINRCFKTVCGNNLSTT